MYIILYSNTDLIKAKLDGMFFEGVLRSNKENSSFIRYNGVYYFKQSEQSESTNKGIVSNARVS